MNEKKNINKVRDSLVLILLGCFFFLPSQAQDHDFSVWSSLNAEHKVSKNFTLNGGMEFRTKEQLKEIDRWAATINGSYRILPALKLGAGYELHYRYRNEKGWKIRQRYHVGVTGEARWSQLKFSLRERFQQTWEKEKTDFHLRSQLKVAYTPHKGNISPYAAIEFYNKLNDGFDLSRTRYRAGGEWQISSRWNMDLYYLYQSESDRKKHVMGIECAYSF
ncbi:DUF2490 domain-containing protein [Phocaeicola sp.]